MIGENLKKNNGRGPFCISESLVKRLSRYHRTLESVAGLGVTYIASRELAEYNWVTSAQVRKDLSSFGNFGKRGMGYPVEGLKQELEQILGLDRRWSVVLVGVGNIGRALLAFGEFRHRGFDIVACFDIDPKKIGHGLRGIPIHHFDDLPDLVKQHGAEIGIIAVPTVSAQEVCNRLLDAGIRAILNFAPVRLEVPDGVTVRYEDMSIELETLSFALTSGRSV